MKLTASGMPSNERWKVFDGYFSSRTLNVIFCMDRKMGIERVGRQFLPFFFFLNFCKISL